jgi:hypothetical protein
MWICTPFGILMPAVRPAKVIPAGDNRTMQVRARHKEYLDIFRERYCPEMGESIHFPNMDYQWKAYCTPQQLAAATAKMMLDIDYEKFKPESSNTKKWSGDKTSLPAGKSDQLHGLYNGIWSQMLTAGDKSSIYDKGWTSGHQQHDARKCYTLGHWYPKSTPKGQPCVDCGHPSACTGCVVCSLTKKGSKNNFPQRGSLEHIIYWQNVENEKRETERKQLTGARCWECVKFGHWYGARAGIPGAVCGDCGHPESCKGCVLCNKRGGTTAKPKRSKDMAHIAYLQKVHQDFQPKDGTPHKSYEEWKAEHVSVLAAKPDAGHYQQTLIPAVGTYSHNSTVPGVLSGLVSGYGGTDYPQQGTTNAPVPGNWNNYVASDDPSCEVVYEDNDVSIFSTDDGYWAQRNGEQGSTGPFESRQAAAEYADVPVNLV